MWVTALALASLLLLKQVEKRLRHDIYLNVKVWGDDSEDFVKRVYQSMESCGIILVDDRLEKNFKLQRMYIEFQIKRRKNCSSSDLLASLGRVTGVKRVRID